MKTLNPAIRTSAVAMLLFALLASLAPVGVQSKAPESGGLLLQLTNADGDPLPGSCVVIRLGDGTDVSVCDEDADALIEVLDLPAGPAVIVSEDGVETVAEIVAGSVVDVIVTSDAVAPPSRRIPTATAFPTKPTIVSTFRIRISSIAMAMAQATRATRRPFRPQRRRTTKNRPRSKPRRPTIRETPAATGFSPCSWTSPMWAAQATNARTSARR